MACTHRCYRATTPVGSCQCSCGGRNHGAGAAAGGIARAPTAPSDQPPQARRAVGPVHPDAAHITSCYQAELVLGGHQVNASLGSALDNEPEFLRGAASAMIDAHDRYPVLHEGRWPLQQAATTSTLAPHHPMAGQLPDGVLAADAFGDGLHVVLLNDDTPRRAHDLARRDHAAADPGMFVAAHRTSYGLVMHELGHAVARSVHGWDGDRRIANAAEQAGFDGFDEIAAVSRYALATPHEFFAEVFAQRNSPEGWGGIDPHTRGRLERFADAINTDSRLQNHWPGRKAL